METISGYIDHIIYQNSDNGYSVLSFIVEDEEETVVGFFKGVTAGESLEITGDYTEHPSYGFQFKASNYRVVEPEDVLSMERYLGSGAIRGVGEKLAKKIIKKFGKDTFRIIEEEPERLSEIKGISSRIAQEIGIQMAEKKDMREAFVFLQQYGISNNMAIKIYGHYGMEIYSIFRENPYRLAEEIHGIGFKTADEIAEKIGIHPDSDYRIRSGILYTLLQASLDGHTCMPLEEMASRCAQMLDLPVEPVIPHVENLAMDRKVTIKAKEDQKYVYASSYYFSELKCARMLFELNLTLGSEYLPSEELQLRKKLENILKTQNLELDELQERAILTAINSGIMILSGGPGTGKTTTINTIIKYFIEEGMDVLLAAPTGRAAKRMTEATGYEAKTIHRMLEINGGLDDAGSKARFERNAENPLEADVIIIDEMSMVDIFLFEALLNAISIGTRLIMVGDADQLPSVGPGRVLKDIMEADVFPVVRLNRIFRQAGESDIVVNAHKINRGEKVCFDNKSKDFFLLKREDAQVIYKHMIQLIREKLPSYVEAEPYDIQVLTPMRKGLLGVEKLNEILQKYLNPEDDQKKEYESQGRLFREGDKVMQIKNNYQLTWQIVSKYGIPIDEGTGVFNGDMGKIISINDHAQLLTVEYDDHRRIEYPYNTLDELELAYAVTVHKSQGSEYPGVIMPILSGPKMLMNRNILYTAVTRAKKCVVILGSEQTINEMIDNKLSYERYTGLADRIREIAEISKE